MGTVVQHLGIYRTPFPLVTIIYRYTTIYTVYLDGTSYVSIFGRKNFEENSSRNVRAPKFQTVLFPILTINACIVIKCVFNFIFTY